jgi:hypothetical protein
MKSKWYSKFIDKIINIFFESERIMLDLRFRRHKEKLDFQIEYGEQIRQCDEDLYKSKVERI